MKKLRVTGVQITRTYFETVIDVDDEVSLEEAQMMLDVGDVTIDDDEITYGDSYDSEEFTAEEFLN